MYSRKQNDESDAVPSLQSYQDKVEKLLSTIEGSMAKMNRNFAEVGTARDRQNSNSSDSSSTGLYGTNKEPSSLVNHRYFYRSESSSSTMSGRSGLPRTIFADASGNTMAVNGTLESTTKSETSEADTSGANSNGSNDNDTLNSALDFTRSLQGLTTSQEEENTSENTPMIVSNDAYTSNTSPTDSLPPTSDFINNQILTLNLLKQLSENYTPSSNDFYYSSLLSNASGDSSNNVSSYNSLLSSSSFLKEMVQKQQLDHQNKLSNRYSIIAEYQQLLDAIKMTSALSQHINHALEEQHCLSMDIYQQMQHQVSGIQENYRRRIESIGLLQEQQRKDSSDEKVFNRTSTSLAKNPPKQKRSSSNCSGKNQFEERKKRKKRRKRSRNMTTNSHDDDCTIKTSSPRLESAFKRFNAQFDKVTVSYMEKLGFTKQECDELLPTFQNEVIRDFRKSWKR